MQCKKCKKEIPDGSAYCNFCGRKQETKRRTKRGNGQGTVYKDGVNWCAEITLGYIIDEGGNRRRKSKRKWGFKTRTAALEYIADLKTDRKAANVNIDTLYESFRKTTYTQLSKSKQTAYNVAWKKIKDDLCYRNIDDLTTDELQDIVDTRGTSYYTKRDIKNLLSHIYKQAMRDDYVQQNKSKFIMLPELKKTEREVFTADEINSIWNEWNTQHTQISAHILIMLYTGMRTGEMLGMKAENIHLQEHYMTGGIKTKKSQNRRIIIPTKIEPIISDLIAHAKTEKITSYSDETYFYDDWAAMQERLNLNKKLVPYCCRHTYVTNCTNLGVSPAMLQELTGHEDYETTLNYNHISVGERFNAVNALYK
jgi:site-specific recombinase XerD